MAAVVITIRSKFEVIMVKPGGDCSFCEKAIQEAGYKMRATFLIGDKKRKSVKVMKPKFCRECGVKIKEALNNHD